MFLAFAALRRARRSFSGSGRYPVPLQQPRRSRSSGSRFSGSNVYLLRKADAAVLVDAGSPSD